MASNNAERIRTELEIKLVDVFGESVKTRLSQYKIENDALANISKEMFTEYFGQKKAKEIIDGLVLNIMVVKE